MSVSPSSPAASSQNTGAGLVLSGLATLGLVALSAVLFFYRLADRDLWSSHEARAGMNAQSMLDGGGWGLPHLYDGRPELQKPPLYYWTVAGLAWLRGSDVDAWAVRLPAAGSAFLCVVALAGGVAWGRRRPLAGLLAGVMLASAAHFTWLARIGRIDMPLTLCVTVTIGGLVLAARSRYRFHLQLAGYLALAAGILFKGPIALVLPAAVLLVHTAWENGLGSLARPRRWLPQLHACGLTWGLPLVAALVLPWFCWAHVHTGGELTRVFFWHHNVERALGGSQLRSNPWWFYGPQLMGDFLPYSPLLILALLACWRYRLLAEDAEARLGLVWLLVVLLVLSCARFKRGDYLLPAYPGAALFLGCLCERGLPAQAGRLALGRRPRLLLVGLLAGSMLLFWLYGLCWRLPAQEPCRDYRHFAADIRRHVRDASPILFFRTEAHALAFHLRPPLDIVVQWEDLDARLAQASCRYLVMPVDCVADVPRYLRHAHVEEVQRNTAYSGSHERPLVLLRACPVGAARQ
jgi:4-amino-4-deoxy-L-arabinose transferase-like glycosyltransferase